MRRTCDLGSLLLGVGGNPELVDCSPQTELQGLTADSRKVAPGVGFVAIRGATHDAHRFVADVAARGAGVAIVQRGAIDAPPLPHVWLDDTAAAMPMIAANAYGRPADSLRLAGVTGTNGKTTTAHLVDGILREAGVPHLRLGTTGNWIVDAEETAGFTTPFPLELQELLARSVERGAKAGVMEVSSHALEQGRARPLHYAAVGITSFSQDHLDFHPTMEAYLQAKCRLAGEHLAPGGVAVAAVDDMPEAARFLDAAPDDARRWRASRGAHSDAELCVRDLREDDRGLSGRVVTPVGDIALRSPLLGTFNVDNLLVAIGLSLGLDVPRAAIEAALPKLQGAPGRLERVISAPGDPLVLVDYAHTPDAVARALATVRRICRGRLSVVLGCGGDRDRGKRPQMGEVAVRGADRFWATSDNPRTEAPEQIVDDMLQGVPASLADRVVRCTDRASAIARAIEEASPGDLVLIAGKGHEDYQILGEARIHFDDREHAQAALQRRRS